MDFPPSAIMVLHLLLHFDGTAQIPVLQANFVTDAQYRFSRVERRVTTASCRVWTRH
jgi:hypothetical protein